MRHGLIEAEITRPVLCGAFRQPDQPLRAHKLPLLSSAIGGVGLADLRLVGDDQRGAILDIAG